MTDAERLAILVEFVTSLAKEDWRGNMPAHVSKAQAVLTRIKETS
jgi:hypothetical protein